MGGKGCVSRCDVRGCVDVDITVNYTVGEMHQRRRR